MLVKREIPAGEVWIGYRWMMRDPVECRTTAVAVCRGGWLLAWCDLCAVRLRRRVSTI
ncbi:hypothetical protein ACNKHV_17125 [Shigella flexneri]